MAKLLASVLIFVLAGGVFSDDDCTEFNAILKDAKSISSYKYSTDRNLQFKGFLQTSADIGFERNRQNFCNASRYWNSDGSIADVLTTAASLMADRDPASLSSFSSHSKCFGRDEKLPASRPKYRPLNGYGNNLKNPHWGMAGAPFGRHGPKNYDDGVYSIRKSVSGSELPNPRRLFNEVLLKAEKYPRTSNDPSEMINLAVLMVTHDMASQVPMEAHNNCKDIRCCSSGNKGVLPKPLQNSACLPIEIPDDDSFYGDKGVKCLNMVRSETVSSPAKIQHGEILNRATAFIDLSILYGTDVVENRKMRSLKGGKMNMGSKNLIPTDSDGKYTPVSSRLTSVPVSAIWPAIFARNHNNLASGLAEINPKWSDEKLFQESRRINIALLQRLILGGTVIEQVFKKRVNESYSENLDASTYLEFTTACYRFLHYYLNPNMRLVTEDNKVTEIPVSDTFGRIDLVEDRFDDVLRGALGHKLNYGQYDEENYNKFAKNKDGVGMDIFSIDIQRGRDHGLPTFLDTRRKCGLNANFKTFDDMIAIFPQSYVDLLKNAYDSVEDIDLIVGGSLESFLSVNTVFVGETMGCVIGEQYRRAMGGDAYFYSNPDSPYPFTPAQHDALRAMKFNNIICVNSGLSSLQKVWFLVDNQSYNTKLPCSFFKQLDLSAWKEI